MSEVRELTKEEITKLLSSGQLSKEEEKFILFIELENTRGSAAEHTERISVLEGDAELILLEHEVREGAPKTEYEKYAIIPKSVPTIISLKIQHWDINENEYEYYIIYVFNGEQWSSITTTSI